MDKGDERTPGPWSTDGRYIRAPIRGPISDVIATVDGWGQRTCAANAAFIVEACNSFTCLREALEPFARLHDEIVFCAGPDGDPNAWAKSCAWEDLKRAKDALNGVTQPASEAGQTWQPIETAPKDGTHIIGRTQFGAREIWWHRDYYEGEFWQDEGDSEPDPTHWVPMPGSVKAQPATEVEKLSTDTEVR